MLRLEGSLKSFMIPLTFSGRVQRGQGIATGLGCPTANISIEGGVVIPALGVYIGKTELDGSFYPSLVYVNDGRDGAILKIEVHLLDECLDLQGKILFVCLLDKLRGMEPWKSDAFIKDLVARDLDDARSWFAGHPKEARRDFDGCG